jgi:hypothetical protein
MLYQVSRNGQMYGPYTLEDLQRYVASGHVQLTDAAKSEDMTEWVPVSQILGTPQQTFGTVPPAAPYSATPNYVAPSDYAYQPPPNLHWGVELLLGFLTCGLFVVVWNIVIATWANRIEPASKALMYYIIATVLIVLNFGSSFGVMISMSHHHHPHQSFTGGLIGIITWVVRLIARFTLRDTLERHYNGPEPIGLRLNPVMTFFFGGIYFQYKLNEINELRQRNLYRSAAL